MTEAVYQSKLIKHFEKRGWFVLKLIATNKNGITDLVLNHPKRPTIWIEVKGEKGRLQPTQKYRIEQLLKLGFIAFSAKPSEFDEVVQTVGKHEKENQEENHSD
jgi:ActR/RegA family two-component response regulator|tara:strand:+ start:992 stop:1303 length:312 start_codon:yes stop_codon:yes gene_type:complete